MIESLSNPTIKNIVKLRKNRARRRQDSFVIDGLREIKVAFDYGFSFQKIIHCPQLSQESWLESPLEPIEVSEPAFHKIAYADNPNGWLAVLEPRYNDISELKVSDKAIILILEGLEKPGNLGAILRSAYAAHVEAVIINDIHTDIYNPNVIKASSGHVFSDKVVVASAEDTRDWLKKNKIKTFATNIKASIPYTEVDWEEGGAIVFGTEATGLSDFWIKEADQNIIIPMKEGIDSLNVSVSASVIMFEAERQRQQNK